MPIEVVMQGSKCPIRQQTVDKLLHTPTEFGKFLLVW